MWQDRGRQGKEGREWKGGGRRGKARVSKERQGRPSQAGRHGKTKLGKERQDKAGVAGMNKERQDNVRGGKARQVLAWLGKAGQARQAGIARLSWEEKGRVKQTWQA